MGTAKGAALSATLFVCPPRAAAPWRHVHLLSQMPSHGVQTCTHWMKTTLGVPTCTSWNRPPPASCTAGQFELDLALAPPCRAPAQVRPEREATRDGARFQWGCRAIESARRCPAAENGHLGCARRNHYGGPRRARSVPSQR